MEANKKILGKINTQRCSVTLIFTINDIFLRTGKNKVALMVNIKHHGFFYQFRDRSLFMAGVGAEEKMVG